MSSAFDLEAARRLPLADAAFRLLDHAIDEDFLTGLFERHRGRSYESAGSGLDGSVEEVADAAANEDLAARVYLRRAYFGR